MSEDAIAAVVEDLLRAQGKSYTAESRLVGDLNLDSITVLKFILELETRLGRTLDDETQLALIEAPVGQFPALLRSGDA